MATLKKLKCLHPVTYLTEGKTYEQWRETDGTHYFVIDNKGNHMPGLFTYRFEPVEETPKLTGGSSSYYELPEDARELGDLIEHKRMNFNVGNIFKAAYRLGDKPGVDELYDLNKIVWFANREINRIKKER